MNTKVPNIDYNEAIKNSGLFRKLGFVLFAVIVYRLGTYVPVPGINSAVLEQIFAHRSELVTGSDPTIQIRKTRNHGIISTDLPQFRIFVYLPRKIDKRQKDRHRSQ